MSVVVTSQVNRSVESRPDHRPQLWDISESGAIENDADIVLLLYRDEVYNKHSDAKNVAEVIVAKNRNGSTGTSFLKFEGSLSRFGNLPSDAPDDLVLPRGI